ncbi:MAG: hypothetical protein ACMZI0_07120 [Symbiopectobacterium sp.]|uniref:hypothetical protein n=1 Tax=Symbiopectobacterium sp. TaxID=2952789 RepID=UPI0039E86387
MKIQEPFEQRTVDASLSMAQGTHRSLFSSAYLCDDSDCEKPAKPSDDTWQNYATFLLNSMPRKMADQFRVNIAQYLSWHRSRGFLHCIPDEDACATEEHDIVS